MAISRWTLGVVLAAFCARLAVAADPPSAPSSPTAPGRPSSPSGPSPPVTEPPPTLWGFLQARWNNAPAQTASSTQPATPAPAGAASPPSSPTQPAPSVPAPTVVNPAAIAAPVNVPYVDFMRQSPYQTPQSSDPFMEVYAPAQQHWLGTKLLLGLPTGVRLQGTLDREENRSYILEGFAGLEPFLFGTVPALGLGGHVSFSLATSDTNDVLLVNPGFDFLYFPGDRDYFFIAPDVEICVVHEMSKHFGVESGIDLGFGLGTIASEKGLRLIPVVSIFTGCRF